MPQRGLVESQLFHLMLREIADAQTICGEPAATHRSQLARNRAQERRFAGAVVSEKPDARTGQDRPIHIGEDGDAVVAQVGVVELEQLPCADLGGSKLE